MMALERRVEMRIADLNNAITSLKAFLALHAPHTVTNMGIISPIESEEDTQAPKRHYIYHSTDPQFDFLHSNKVARSQQDKVSKVSKTQSNTPRFRRDSNESTASDVSHSSKDKFTNGIFPTPDLSPLTRNVARSNNDITDAELLPPLARPVPVSGCLTPISTVGSVNASTEELGDAVKERLDDDRELQLRRIENGKLFFSRGQDRKSDMKRNNGPIRRWRSRAVREEEENRTRKSKSEDLPSSRLEKAAEDDDNEYPESCRSEGSIGKRKEPFDGELPAAKRRMPSVEKESPEPELPGSPTFSSSSSEGEDDEGDSDYKPVYNIPSSPYRKRKFDDELDEHLEVSKRLLSEENRIAFKRQKTDGRSPMRRLLRKHNDNDAQDSDCEDLRTLSGARKANKGSSSFDSGSFSSSPDPTEPKKPKVVKKKPAAPKVQKQSASAEKASQRKQLKEDFRAKVRADLFNLQAENSYENFPVGMTNTTRNSCFINVVMQILYRIDECRRYLLERAESAPPKPEGVKIRRKASGRNSRVEQKVTGFQPAGKLVDALCRDMRFMHSTVPQTSFNPVDFVSAVSEHFHDRNCDPCVQSDAMEFLELLYGYIQDEVAKEHGPSGSDLSPAETDFVACFQGDKKHMFGCLSCNSKWEANESFEQLLVPIHGGSEALSEHLNNHFVDSAELGGPGRPCDCNSEIWRQTRLAKLPATLRVVLQRTLDGKGKNSHHVQFPSQLKLGGEICDKTVGEGNYDLFGVIVHAGRVASGGHYTCYVKQDNYWFHLDDVNSRLVTVEEVMMAEATALFYHQHSEGQVMEPVVTKAATPDIGIQKSTSATDAVPDPTVTETATMQTTADVATAPVATVFKTTDADLETGSPKTATMHTTAGVATGPEATFFENTCPEIKFPESTVQEDTAPQCASQMATSTSLETAVSVS